MGGVNPSFTNGGKYSRAEEATVDVDVAENSEVEKVLDIACETLEVIDVSGYCHARINISDQEWSPRSAQRSRQ